jgi:hypothetical protein
MGWSRNGIGPWIEISKEGQYGYKEKGCQEEKEKVTR